MLITIGSVAIPLEGIRKVVKRGKTAIVYYDNDLIRMSGHDLKGVGFEGLIAEINRNAKPHAQTAVADQTQSPASAASGEV